MYYTHLIRNFLCPIKVLNVVQLLFNDKNIILYSIPYYVYTYIHTYTHTHTHIVVCMLRYVY